MSSNGATISSSSAARTNRVGVNSSLFSYPGSSRININSRTGASILLVMVLAMVVIVAILHVHGCITDRMRMWSSSSRQSTTTVDGSIRCPWSTRARSTQRLRGTNPSISAGARQREERLILLCNLHRARHLRNLCRRGNNCSGHRYRHG